MKTTQPTPQQSTELPKANPEKLSEWKQFARILDTFFASVRL
ncbi:MAG: hypothetical protein R3C49_21560 [Planctomycetaceae bacterium]